jgi:dihydroxyacetone synthase
MSGFGKSLPGKDAYKFFGFEAKTIAPKVFELVDDVRAENLESLRGEFRDLNGKHHEH